MTTVVLDRPSVPCSQVDSTAACPSTSTPAVAAEPGPTSCALTGGACPSDVSQTVNCPGC
jgi:hypothetical protein